MDPDLFVTTPSGADAEPTGGAAAPNAATANATAAPAAAVVALMGSDLPFAHNIPNAFLASAPGHPLWLDVLRAVQVAAAGRCSFDWVEEVRPCCFSRR
jgi:hypothetical protein